MRFSTLVERIGGEGATAWDVHVRAMQRVRRGDDIIVLSVGDPDFGTPPRIVDTAIESLRAGNTHYIEVVGQRRLREAIARRHEAMTRVPTTADEVVVFAGAQNALFASALCVLDRGHEVIALDPAYVTYDAVVGVSGASLVRVPMARDRDFHLDAGALERAVTDRTRAILLNTPHNPTGVVLTRDEVQSVAEICRRHDLWLISDEVYAAITFERTHVGPCGLPGMAERTVTIGSLSKSHAMTGWRVGWAVAPPKLVPHLTNLALCMLYGGPGFIHDAAAAALTAELAEVTAMRDELRIRRDLVCDMLGGLPGFECLRPEGAMFVMVDVHRTSLSATEFAVQLLDRHAVSVLPADAFGPTARGFVRISLSVDCTRLAEACERIGWFARELAAQAPR